MATHLHQPKRALALQLVFRTSPTFLDVVEPYQVTSPKNVGEV